MSPASQHFPQRNDPAYLVLMRHGPALEHFEWQGSDRDRPLTTAGIEVTKKVCAIIADRYRPTLILSSEYIRARQTADLLLGAVKEKIDFTVVPELNQNRPWGDWREAWAEIRESLAPESVVVAVGHGPSINEILCWHSGIDFNVGLKKAGFAALKDARKLTAWVSPKLLILGDQPSRSNL